MGCVQSKTPKQVYHNEKSDSWSKKSSLSQMSPVVLRTQLKSDPVVEAGPKEIFREEYERQLLWNRL